MAPPGLTAEQRARAEANRVEALARREARVEAQGSTAGSALAALAGAVAQPPAPAPLVQTTLQPQAPPFAFLQPLGANSTTVHINAPFVPEIGSDQLPAPKPRTLRSAGEILAIKAGCGQGKSLRFRQYMQETVYAVKPAARVLLVSANILYGTNLTHELQQAGFPLVGFYREGVDLSTCQTVVCSLESLHHLDGQRFDVMLIDEVHKIAGLVGGATMRDFNNVYLMRELCAHTPQIIVCDADLDFKIDPSEPHTLVHDFLREIAPDRSVRCVVLTQRPAHLQRSARLFFACSKEEGGEEAAAEDEAAAAPKDGRKNWFAEVKQACAAWRDDHSMRFAVCVGGSSGQLAAIYGLMKQEKVPCKPYSSKTNDNSKFEDLKDPGSVWLEFGCIASTTSLSIGVDPKGIRFARVFMWTCRTGCTLREQFQAAMRFGREKELPLVDKCVCSLVHCIPPGLRAQLVAAGKKQPLKPPTYDDELKKLQRRLGATARRYAQEESLAGGRPLGVPAIRLAADSMLRIMAHGRLERAFQKTDHFTALERCLAHYGWSWQIDDSAAAEQQPADLSEFDNWEIDDDDEFAVGLGDTDKYKWALHHVVDRGDRSEVDFLFDCYGLAAKNRSAQSNMTGKEKFLVRMFWLLKPLGEIPWQREEEEEHAGGGASGGIAGAEGDAGSEEGDEGGEESDEGVEDMAEVADEERPTSIRKTAILLVELEKAHAGMQLNAFGHCVSFEEAMRHDNAKRNDPDVGLPNPLLKSAPGAKMACIDAFAKLIGVENPYESFELCKGEEEGESTIIDVARRQTLQLDRPSDTVLLSSLRACAEELRVGDERTVTVPQMLKGLARACGMECKLVTKQERQPDGKRPRLLESASFERVLPEIVSIWDVWSSRKQSHVRVADWQQAHETLEEEEIQEAYDALDPAHFADSGSSAGGEQRKEKIDGLAHWNQLQRLRAKHNPTKQDVRWLGWLERADQAAQPSRRDGEPPPPVRSITVTYHKRRAIGRRTASYPSMQNCPSGLRPHLVKRFYMVNCHPVLMLQVALKMCVPEYELETLDEYVRGAEDDEGRTGRERILHRIATHFGVSRAWAKEAVLRVLNGGSIQKWIADAKCTRGRDEPQADLEELQAEARRVQAAFFAMPNFQPHVETLRQELAASTKAALDRAKVQGVMARAQSAGARAAAQKQLENARAKAKSEAINRSIFSHCIFELEDSVLKIIDEHFRESGWTVSSLQYDGMHVEHRRRAATTSASSSWNARHGIQGRAPAAFELKPVIAGAEAAVKTKLGYDIQLTEKELFGHASPDEQPTAEEEDIEMANADIYEAEE